MTDELLPALPEPSFQLKWRNAAYYVSEPNIGDTNVFTADQLRAYAREAIRQQWRPMDSSPKSSDVLLWCTTNEACLVGMHCGEAGWLTEDGYGLTPTHWMPLPSPPAGEVA